MNRRYGMAALGLWIGAGVALGAATKIWERPLNTWTDVELKEMLTSSPWAGKGSIARVRQNGVSNQALEEVVVVSWYSALPMRQAAVREQIAVGAAVPADVEAALARPLEVYTLGVKVSGTANATSYARTAAVSQAETFLLREGKPSLAPVQSEGRWLDKEGKRVEMPPVPPRGGGFGAPRGGGAVPQNGPLMSVQGGGGRGGGGGGFGGGPPGGGGGGPKDGASLLLFAFAKSDVIALADKEVEFVSKLCSQSFGGGGFGGGGGQAAGANATPPCNLSIKKKFKLKDMVIKGELAL